MSNVYYTGYRLYDFQEIYEKFQKAGSKEHLRHDSKSKDLEKSTSLYLHGPFNIDTDRWLTAYEMKFTRGCPPNRGPSADWPLLCWAPTPSERLLIIEFPTLAAARAWYESPEYQALLPLRLNASGPDNMLIVDGAGAEQIIPPTVSFE
jgi:hypothetical protein